jgi:predicted secreted protein
MHRTKHTKLPRAVGLALLAAMGACSTPDMAPRKAPKTVVTLTPTTPETVFFSGVPGTRVAIDLPFRAGTGYAWQASGFDPNVVAEAGTEERRATSGESVGAAMIATMSFDLLAQGETEILLERRRPWEKDAPAAESRRVRVVVH